MSKIVWQPQPRQAAFMARSEYEALYGGAAGGGKSDALVVEALRQVNIPWYKGLILRKTYPDLTELIEKSLRYYTQSYPGARYNDSKHFWQFPSGAKIYFGAMQYTKDRTKYQGKAYDYIAFDELTHFTWDEYSYLFSRNRPNGPGTRVYIRASANPGGIGHAWEKNISSRQQSRSRRSGGASSFFSRMDTKRSGGVPASMCPRRCSTTGISRPTPRQL